VAAVTPAIEDHWSVGAQLGERFLRFRLRGDARFKKVEKALRDTTDEPAMRAELENAAVGVLMQEPDIPDVPDDIQHQLAQLADFVSMARSVVSRDRDGVMQFVPAPEIGTRLAKSLKKLGMGIAMARGEKVVSADVFAIVRRVGLDTIP